MHDHLVTARLLGSASALALLLAPGATTASGLPSSGHFVSGKGEIGKAAQSLTVEQSSTTGIIDWSSFSIGKQGGVTFDNGSGATLNRVTGGNLSRIAGYLHATGSLFLLDSQGVIVSGSGRVVTGGNFVASSATLYDSAFGEHHRRLGDADAKVVNRGSITAGGEARLVGSRVANIGTISSSYARLRAADGDVLAAGTIRASGGVHHDAQILVISNTGAARISGALIAKNRDGSGGRIETSGSRLFVGGRIDAGKGGTWLVDPENLTVDASAAETIDKSLQAGTNVTLKTTASGTSGPGNPSSGTGNIVIAAKISWNSKATLELDAFHSVIIDAPIDVAGDGGLTVVTNDGAGSLAFSGGTIMFGDLSDRLTIDGMVYTLVDSVKGLASAVSAHPAGYFALAQSDDAAGDGTYSTSPVATAFVGTFIGLGNTISHLAIDAGTKDSVGLFSSIGADGTVEDLSLDAVQIVGGTAVGALAGANAGAFKDDTVAGTVNGQSETGGLAGTNTGKIDGDSSSVKVIDTHGTQKPGITGSVVGDLIGYNEIGGVVEDSLATGNVRAVDSSDVGGVAGRNAGIVESSHATGAVHGFNATGGLVGNDLGTVEQSWSSGSVQGLRYVGGLVGFSDAHAAVTEDSYATGAVVADAGGKDEGGLVGYLAGTAKVTDCYATGDVKGNDAAGGLVGLNEGEIDSSYATGAVSGLDDIGGIVGINAVSGSDAGTISASYSTGSVKGEKDVGGSVGENAGTLSSLYWDTQTSGTTAGVGLQDPGGRGNAVSRTTVQLRASLPAGFARSAWGLNSHINNGFPYLIALASSY